MISFAVVYSAVGRRERIRMALNEENERGGYRADSSAGTDEEYFELLDRRRRELARGRADKPENPSTAPP